MRGTFSVFDLLPAIALPVVGWLWWWVVKLRLRHRGQPYAIPVLAALSMLIVAQAATSVLTTWRWAGPAFVPFEAAIGYGYLWLVWRRNGGLLSTRTTAAAAPPGPDNPVPDDPRPQQ